MNRVFRLPFFRPSALIIIAVIIGALAFPGGIGDLFSASGFMPHATCYMRNGKMIFLHVSSDLLIGCAYVVISCTLGYLIYKASESIPFNWMFLAFGVFIISCGFTHFMEVWTVWKPVYWLAGYVKVVTAVASVTTAVALLGLMPKIFALINSVKLSEERRLALVEAHKELEQQTKELKIANEELEMFTYSVAHDLRAPLRSISTLTELLNEDYAEKLDATARDYTGRIRGSTTKMNDLITDLLAYSHISRGDFPIGPVRLDGAAAEAIKTEVIEAERTNAQIISDTLPTTVMANQTVLTQVIVNLVSNAIKFVAPGTQPVVRLRTEKKNGAVRLWVEDNGIGIDPEYHKRIFEMFQRLHSSMEYSGTGIGLAIVQRGVKRMNGRLGVESTLGKGSRFWIEFDEAR